MSWDQHEVIKRVILIDKSDRDLAERGIFNYDDKLRVWVEEILPVDRRNDVWAVVAYFQGDLSDPEVSAKVLNWRSRYSQT